MPAKKKRRRHGTMTAYVTGGCRCPRCRLAYSQYRRSLREKKAQAYITGLQPGAAIVHMAADPKPVQNVHNHDLLGKLITDPVKSLEDALATLDEIRHRMHRALTILREG